MRDRVLLLVYLAWVVGVTLIHDPRWLLAGLLLVLLLAGRRAPAIVRRALRAFVWFNLIVTVSYVAFSLWSGRSPWGSVALINARVALLTTSTFFMIAHVNPLRAASFSRPLTYLLTIAYSQILTQQRVLAEFQQALRSRTLGRVSLRELYRHRAAAGGLLFGRGLQDAAEITLALRSRGFFDDQR